MNAADIIQSNKGKAQRAHTCTHFRAHHAKLPGPEHDNFRVALRRVGAPDRLLRGGTVGINGVPSVGVDLPS